ncbi:hypothetical protein BO71DRAFT_411612 [Aspergillus ellipticus CBS 707.79]|uniref:Uncharacterized protein n=1 Tax=Aspergillus ellipticus CBS 707.79 TaxID=1448320 RepID=A0A319D343_9EURO|nr:hypothetical protein BO71DRAFT_411612 [Aspergillus ellipticus CBS 707.79]
MTTEIFLTPNQFTVPLCWKCDHGTPIGETVEINEILENPRAFTFIFRNPHHLWSVFSDEATYNLITRHIRNIQLYLYHDILEIDFDPPEPTINVPEPLDCEALLAWPNVDAVALNWRSACRAIPRDHAVRFVVFDVSTPHGLVPTSQTGQLLQILSTSISLKAIDTPAFRSAVQGCDHNTWLDLEIRLSGSVFRLGWAPEG